MVSAAAERQTVDLGRRTQGDREVDDTVEEKERQKRQSRSLEQADRLINMVVVVINFWK